MKKYSDTIIEISDIQDSIPITENFTDIIRSCIAKATEDLSLRVMVEVTLTDNQGIRKINQSFRKVDKATDVLSFPMIDLKPGDDILVPDDFLCDSDPATGAVLLGDIMISMEKAAEQAKEYGHSIERELGYLTVHGILHLLGYDHLADDDKVIMRREEEAILSCLGLDRLF
ncbi:MAG: rRNA maturation RNase YbeY [Clostridiales bacterium]|nr:rRNA maturation RNase YbeY [Clostridiales bacterium]